MRFRNTLLLAALVAAALFVLGGAVASAQSAQTYSGYLIDTACGTSGKGADGSNTFTSPQDHTKACALVCKASGFGMMVKSGSKYSFVKFDPAGSNLALNQIVNGTKKTKALTVSVTGVLSNGVLTVQSIKEMS